MSLLVMALLSSVGWAQEARPTLNACDHLVQQEQMQCIKAAYPSEYELVWVACEDVSIVDLQVCRDTQFAELGITLHHDGELPSVSDSQKAAQETSLEAHYRRAAERARAASSDPLESMGIPRAEAEESEARESEAEESEGEESKAQGASPGTSITDDNVETAGSVGGAPRADCDGISGPAQLECIREHYPEVVAHVKAACQDSPDGQLAACRAKKFAEEGIAFNRRDPSAPHPATAAKSGKRLNPAVVSVVVETALVVAGNQLVTKARNCTKNPRCKMRPSENQALRAFGNVLLGTGPAISQVMAGPGTDTEKINAILGVLNAAIANAPTGLSPEAMVGIQAGIGAIRTVIAAVGN